VNLPASFDPGRFAAAVEAARRYQQVPARGTIRSVTVLEEREENGLVQVTLHVPRLGNRLPSDFDHGVLHFRGTGHRGSILSTEQPAPGQLSVIVSISGVRRSLPQYGSALLYPYDHLAALWAWARSIEELPSGVTDLLSQVVLRAPDPPEPLSPEGIEPLDKDQRRALRAAARESFLLWGPPGTGKTHTLASTVAAMRREQWRVAVLALSNAAVDVATLAIDDACNRLGSPLQPGDLIRLGTPRHPALEEGERPHLLAFQAELRMVNSSLANARRTLFATVRVINAARSAGREAPRRALRLRATLLELIRTGEDRRRTITSRFIESAGIICSTAASFIGAGGLLPRMDAIIVDEGSQMPLALLYYIAAQRPRRLHIVGDPMQLPPIVPNPRGWNERPHPAVEELFGVSRFQLAGLDPTEPGFDDAADALEQSGGLVPLLVQRRMVPAIGEVVGQLAYRGRLRHATSAVALPDTGVLPREPLVHVNSGIPGRTNSSQAQAELTRRLVLALARNLTPDPAHTGLLVITPYRKQEALLRDLLGGTPGVRVLTIHKAQGSEASTVVLDVPAPLNRFLDNPGEARLLWNVAISRAQHRLVLVAPANIAANRWIGPHLHRFTPARGG